MNWATSIVGWRSRLVYLLLEAVTPLELVRTTPRSTGGLVGGLAEEGGELPADELGAAAGGAERREGVGGGDEGVVRVEAPRRALRVVAVG